MIADALLSEKQSSAKSNSTRIDFDGFIPPTGISPMDMCVILWNLLDNALEACAEISGEKAVNISFGMNNGFFLLTISNPIKENVIIRGNTLITSKKDKEDHGIGLISVKNAIQKYNGKLSISVNDQIFAAKIILDLNEQIYKAFA